MDELGVVCLMWPTGEYLVCYWKLEVQLLSPTHHQMTVVRPKEFFWSKCLSRTAQKWHFFTGSTLYLLNPSYQERLDMFQSNILKCGLFSTQTRHVMPQRPFCQMVCPLPSRSSYVGRSSGHSWSHGLNVGMPKTLCVLCICIAISHSINMVTRWNTVKQIQKQCIYNIYIYIYLYI